MARPKKLPEGMQLRGKVYYARFMKDGRRIKKRLSSDLDTARKALNVLRARADAGDFDILDNDFAWTDLKAEYLRWARQVIRRPKELEQTLTKFESYCRVSTVRQIDHKYVIGYRDWRLAQFVVRGKKDTKNRITPRTVNKEVSALRSMLGKAVEWGRIASNPIEGIKPLAHDTPRKQRRALTAAEVEAVFTACPAWLRPVLRTLATTGMRKRELIELRFSDVDFEGRSVRIRAEIAKNHKAREIPLDDATLEMLEALRDEAGQRQPVAGKAEWKFSRDHVFVTRANTPLQNNLLTRFYAVCKKAGIEGAYSGGSVDLHSLRVTFTTLSLENGAAPKAVQAVLGHSTLALTMGTYAKATERGKRDAVGCLPFAKMTAPAGIVAFPVQIGPDLAPSTKKEPGCHSRQAANS